jgi:hypothetical protein
MASCHVGAAALAYGLLWRDRRPVIVGLLFAVGFTQTVSLLLISVILVTRRAYREFAAVRAGRMAGPIRDLFAATLSGVDMEALALRAAAARYPRYVDECCLEMLPTVKGSGREMLSALAAEFGTVARWQVATGSRFLSRRRRAGRALALLSSEFSEQGRLRMIDSVDSELRLTGLRMTARAGNRAGVVEVASRLAGLCLFERALLAEDLKVHAPFLCQEIFPEILASHDTAMILAVLELLNGWKRTMQMSPLLVLLDHPDARVRGAALSVLPYEVTAQLATPTILIRLRDDSPAVRLAAAIAAGKLCTEGALPVLSDGLRDLDPEVARTCAHAIARFGQAGIEVLEEQVTWGDTDAAAFAMEALESARAGRVGVST